MTDHPKPLFLPIINGKGYTKSEVEAIRDAYRDPIPAARLYDVDKTATICGPSANEIVRKAEERPEFRGRKRRGEPVGRP